MPQSQDKCIADLRINLIGLPRSGGHALISWIAGMCKNAFLIEYLICQPNKFPVNHIQCDGKSISEKWYDIKKDKESAILNDVYPECVIFKNEKAVPKNYQRYGTTQRKELLEIAGKKRIANNEVDIVFIRSPWNAFASLLEGRWRLSRKPLRFASNWVHYAREFLGITNYLPDAVFVVYDFWVLNANYRKAVASRIGLNYSDFGMNYLISNKSSFDDRNFQTDATKMDVTNRWKKYIDTDRIARRNRFFKIYNSHALRLFSYEIFGGIPFDLK